MKKSFFFLLITLLFITTYSCKKAEEPNQKQIELNAKINAVKKAMLDTLPIKCNGIQSDYYFKGKLKGRDICLSDGEDNYNVFNAVWLTFITKSPQLVITNGVVEGNSTNFLGLYIQHSPYEAAKYNFKFITPNVLSDSNYQIKDFLEKKILKKNLILRQKGMSDTTGIDIQLEIPITVTDSSSSFTLALILRTASGLQTRSSFIKLSDYKVEEFSSSIFYDLTFEFECDLYDLTDLTFYGRITEGKFCTQVIVPR